MQGILNKKNNVTHMGIILCLEGLSLRTSLGEVKSFVVLDKILEELRPAANSRPTLGVLVRNVLL